MNRKTLIACAAAALLAATTLSAHAKRGMDEAYGEAPAVSSTSTLTREEVLAAVIASRHHLSIDRAYGAEPAAEVASTLTREAVQAELFAARAEGRLDPGGEYSTPDRVFAAQQRHAQAQSEAAQLQARVEAERLQAQMEAERQLLPMDAQRQQASAQAEQPMAEGALASEGALPAAEPGAVGAQMNGESAEPAAAEAMSLSDQPADMPHLVPADDRDMDRQYRVYIESDEDGVLLPYFDELAP